MLIQPLTILKERDQAGNNDAEDVIQGLRKNPKTLPAKYLYDHDGSQLFEKICELPEYYPTRTEAFILSESADEIAQITGTCELLELGSGSSTKTRILLDAYQSQGYHCKYVPIDVSESILKYSVNQLQQQYPNLHIKALVGTYEQALAQLTPTALPARMIFFLGSSMGNFTIQEYDTFLNQINDVLNPGDYFLLGIDLQKPKEILEAAYNDSQGVTSAFNLNILSHLNWRFQGNFNINSFTHQATYNQQENQIEMYLHCQESQVVHLQNLDLKVNFQAGEYIRTEISRKFQLEAVQKELELKGLKPLKVFTDPRNWFGLILCQSF